MHIFSDPYVKLHFCKCCISLLWSKCFENNSKLRSSSCCSCCCWISDREGVTALKGRSDSWIRDIKWNLVNKIKRKLERFETFICINSKKSALWKESDRPPLQGTEELLSCMMLEQLLFHVTMINKVAVDFRWAGAKADTVSILGEEVEVVESCRYLGVHLDNRLDWRCNTEAAYRKGQSKLYFLIF